MLSTEAAIGVLGGVLMLFAWIGVRAGARFGVGDRDRYLTARASQPALIIALNLYASALGAWILFSPPEVGTFAGFLGVLGYALGQAAAVAIFALLGPAVRRRLPTGTTVLQFARSRYGRAAEAYVGGVSLLYMFVFLTAELTAIGGVVSIISGADPLAAIIPVAAVTAAYTAYGGLPASIETDRWQAWLVMSLIAVAGVAVAVEIGDPVASARAGGFGSFTRSGAETLVVLVIAIVAANLFHQGFWQRVWAARDERAVVWGAAGAGALIVPTVFLAGVAGMVAAGAGRADEPSLAFFDLLSGLPAPVLALVVALGIALVASSVDTLQNALTSLLSVHVAGGRTRLGAARAITIAVTVPAAWIASEGLSVLRLFLVADLLAATIAIPVFAGLWRRATAPGAIAGAIAGVAAVVAVGWVRGDGLADGLRLLTLPDGPSLGAFVAAPLASGVVTVAGSLIRPGRRRAAL